MENSKNTHSMANPMAVTLDTFNAVTGNYTQHYFINSCSSGFTGQDFPVSWDQFAAAVNSFMSTNNVPADSVALVFTYCYDISSCCFYLQMQICKMDTSVPSPYPLLATPSAYYELRDSSMVQIANPLPMPNPSFLSSFYYCNSQPCNSGSAQQLATNPNLYVQSVVFPWAIEVQQMYLDNSSPQGATINFAGCCFDQGGGSQLQFPQSLVLYLRDSQGNRLMDNITYKNDFQMKGCDMATVCPPKCGVYALPVTQHL